MVFLSTTGELQQAANDAVPEKAIPAFGEDKKEQDFQKWFKDIAKKVGLNPNPDDPRHQFDYRRAFEAGVKVDEASGFHFDSRFKLAGHPNRFVNGVDTITGRSITPQSATLGFFSGAGGSTESPAGNKAVAQQMLRERALGGR